MARDEELRTDPVCERCGAPLVDTRSSVVRDAAPYCCVHCARADAADVAVHAGSSGQRACSRCGAPIPDPRQGIHEGALLFCCPNCSAAGIHAEPLPEA